MKHVGNTKVTKQFNFHLVTHDQKRFFLSFMSVIASLFSVFSNVYNLQFLMTLSFRCCLTQRVKMRKVRIYQR